MLVGLDHCLHRGPLQSIQGHTPTRWAAFVCVSTGLVSSFILHHFWHDMAVRFLASVVEVTLLLSHTA